MSSGESLDRAFPATGDVATAYVDERTGERHIVGVASGVKEDRDDERVSRRAIKAMVNKVRSGGVKLTAGHQRDWLTEIGDVVNAWHDPEADELIIDTVVPAKGEDPIADKAWKTARERKAGFSIEGKLIGFFYERNEAGKHVRVLDDIDLRHIALTLNPSYAARPAEAVIADDLEKTVFADDGLGPVHVLAASLPTY